MQISETFKIGKGTSEGFCLIMAPAGPETILFIFHETKTESLLIQALQREDVHLYVAPPVSP